MDHFVVGFAFTEDRKKVLLITKNRPAWQNGCLNGVGGKIEHGESQFAAMTREGIEETGLDLPWDYKGVMKGTNNDGTEFRCHIFYSWGGGVEDFVQKEDEPLALYSPLEICQYRHVSNLEFLIPYGLCNDHSTFMNLEY